jgi:hypothetical protein
MLSELGAGRRCTKPDGHQDRELINGLITTAEQDV